MGSIPATLVIYITPRLLQLSRSQTTSKTPSYKLLKELYSTETRTSSLWHTVRRPLKPRSFSKSRLVNAKAVYTGFQFFRRKKLSFYIKFPPFIRVSSSKKLKKLRLRNRQDSLPLHSFKLRPLLWLTLRSARKRYTPVNASARVRNVYKNLLTSFRSLSLTFIRRERFLKLKRSSRKIVPPFQICSSTNREFTNASLHYINFRREVLSHRLKSDLFSVETPNWESDTGVEIVRSGSDRINFYDTRILTGWGRTRRPRLTTFATSSTTFEFKPKSSFLANWNFITRVKLPVAQLINKPGTNMLTSKIFSSRVSESDELFTLYRSSSSFLSELSRNFEIQNPALFRTPYQVFESTVSALNLPTVNLSFHLGSIKTSLAVSSLFLVWARLLASQGTVIQVLSASAANHRTLEALSRLHPQACAVPEHDSGSYFQVKTLYNSYYNVLQLTQSFGRKGIKRPLYSVFFQANFLRSKSIVILDRFSKFIPLRKRVSLKRYNRSTPYKGFLNQLFFTYSDNTFEVYAQGLGPRNLRKLDHLNAYQNFKHQKHQASNPFHGVGVPSDVISPTTLTSLSPTLGHSPSHQHQLNPILSLNRNLNPLLFSNLTVFKFLFWDTSSNSPFLSCSLNLLPTVWLSHLSSLTFSDRLMSLTHSNLWPIPSFYYSIKRRVIKMVSSNKYLPQTTTFFYRTLVNFIEFLTGKQVYLKFNPFIENSLSYLDLSRCYLWYNRVLSFQKILGHRIFLHESLKIVYLALKFRDPTFLINWIKAMLYRMSFWKYRILFRYLKYILRNLFWAFFPDLDFKGIRISLRGKISVAGNARSRSLTYSIGKTAHSSFDNRVLSQFVTIDSFTGVMGFRVSFYF